MEAASAPDETQSLKDGGGGRWGGRGHKRVRAGMYVHVLPRVTKYLPKYDMLFSRDAKHTRHQPPIWSCALSSFQPMTSTCLKGS